MTQQDAECARLTPAEVMDWIIAAFFVGYLLWIGVDRLLWRLDMRDWQKSIGRDAAIKLYESGWWKDKTAREVAEFQMHIAELCMPFGDFQMAVQGALGRPVWTHEFGLDMDGLLAELMGERPAPDFASILALLPPAEKVVVIGA